MAQRRVALPGAYRGQTLVLFAVFLPVLVLFAALTIDVWRLLAAQQQLDAAAMLGARAGADQLSEDVWRENGRVADASSYALQAAQDIARYNLEATGGGEVREVSVSGQSVTVQVARTVRFLALGQRELTSIVTASAGLTR